MKVLVAMSANLSLLKNLQKWRRQSTAQSVESKEHKAHRKSLKALMRLDAKTLKDVTGMTHRELRHRIALETQQAKVSRGLLRKLFLKR